MATSLRVRPVVQSKDRAVAELFCPARNFSVDVAVIVEIDPKEVSIRQVFELRYRFDVDVVVERFLELATKFCSKPPIFRAHF